MERLYVWARALLIYVVCCTTLNNVQGVIYEGEISSSIKYVFKQILGQKLLDQDLMPIKGGLSGFQIYRIKQNNKDCIARVASGRLAGSVEKEVNAIQEASNAGIGPEVYYANQETGLVIMDYIEDFPLKYKFTPIFHQRLAAMLREFHTCKLPLPQKTIFQTLDELVLFLKNRKYILPFKTAGDVDFFTENNKKVALLFQKYEDDITSVHHDLNPFNLLVNEQELKIIDWETASQDYFYVDLAVFVNFHIFDESQVDIFLEQYFGREVLRVEKAKFTVIRVFSYLLHACWIAKIAELKQLPDNLLELPYAEMTKRCLQRKIDLHSKENQLAVAFVRSKAALDLMRSAAFQNAVELL